MPPALERVIMLAVVLVLASPIACGRTPRPEAGRRVVVGAQRVRLTAPGGWEHLDHGAAQLFRLGEAELALEDAGPATPEGLARELDAAAGLWREGRPRDALEQIRRARNSPASRALTARGGDPWREWDALHPGPDTDPRAAAVLDAMRREVVVQVPTPLLRLAESGVGADEDLRRHEIVHRQAQVIHGARWVVLDTWDRTSHLGRRRHAYCAASGRLLTLRARRGLAEQTDPAFDALLGSIEVE